MERKCDRIVLALLQKPCMGVRRDVARFINCMGTAGPLTAFNRVFDCYIRVYRSFSILLVGHSQLLVGQGPYQAHPWLRL